VLTGTNAKYSIFGDVAYAWLLANLTTLTLNGRVTDIDAGICTADKLYRIGKTEANHYFVGCAVGDYFTSDGTETNDANNTVLEVIHLGTDAVTIVSTVGGATQNWASIDAGFDPNDPAMTYQITINVQATTDDLILTEYPAIVNAEISIQALTNALVLTEYSAIVNAETNIQANIDSLILTEYSASIMLLSTPSERTLVVKSENRTISV
jgi:hypothetical protein